MALNNVKQFITEKQNRTKHASNSILSALCLESNTIYGFKYMDSRWASLTNSNKTPVNYREFAGDAE